MWAEIFLAAVKSKLTVVVGEYCWAIAQATGRSCCDQSGGLCWSFGFQLNSLLCMRAIREVSVHFEYLENRSPGLDVTWQPVRRDLTSHP